MRVLLTWIGKQDPWRPAGGRLTGRSPDIPHPKPADYEDGPILTFLAHSEPFDVVFLLHDRAATASGAVTGLSQALTERFPKLQLRPQYIPSDDPRAYEPLYRYMRAACEQAYGEFGATADYNVLLSPGTPQMHATWLLLTKTVFTAQAWQTSEHANLSRAERVSIPFDIAAELIEPAVAAAGARSAQVHRDLIYISDAMRRTVELVERAAPATATVLLLGPSGVGKERLANLLHHLSTRQAEPFVAVNCGAIPELLMESELFGHKRGAFTDAKTDRQGLFELAQGGTIFLDEVAELPPPMQVKLLRVLQERSIRPVGAAYQIPIKVRVVAATHQDLVKRMKEGLFREDLYYRLHVVPIVVPPLRERREDILLLADHFLAVANAKRHERALSPIRLAADTRRLLERHDWPGNVRELENLIERFGVVAEKSILHAREVRALVPSLGSPMEPPSIGESCEELDLREELEKLERRLIEEALAHHGTQKKAALALGFKTQQALQGRIAKLRLRPLSPL